MAHKFDGTILFDAEGKAVRVVGSLSAQALPLEPANLRLVEATDALISIAWDNAADAISWKVYRDNGAGGPLAFYATSSSPAYVDNVVDDGTTYVYAVKAVNVAGDSVNFSNQLTVTSEVAVVLPVPTGLATTEITARRVSLQWDAMNGALEYDVFRNLVYLATVAAPAYTDSTVAQSSSYSYKVLARYSSGDSALSSALLVDTLANRSPAWTVDPISATVGVPYSQDLNGLCVDPDGDILSYSELTALPAGLVLNGTIISGIPTTPGSVNSGVRANDGLTTADITLAFTVAAAVDTTAPTTPVISGAVNSSSITLSIVTPSTDANGIDFYRVLRKSPGESVFSVRAEPEASAFPYSESGLAPGSHDFKIRAFDPAGNQSAFSNTVTLVVAPVVTVPDAPINPAVVLESADDARFSWQAGPSGPAATFFDVQYSIQADGGSSTGPWVDGLSVAASVFNVLQMDLPTGRTWFQVKARNASGSSGYTSAVSVMVGGSIGAANFIIPANGTDWDGSDLRTDLVNGGAPRAVRPGDIIEFAAGTHASASKTFSNIVGSAGNRITLRGPSTGQAVFRRANASGSGFVTRWTNCRHVNVTGFTTDSGAPVELDGKRHGIKFMYAQNAAVGNKDNPTSYSKFKGTSDSGTGAYTVTRDITFSYCHWDGGWDPVAGNSLNATGTTVGFSTNDQNYKRANFVGQFQENIILEHALIEGMGGEGTYCGANPFLAPNPEVPLRYIKTRYSMFYLCGGNGVSYKGVYGGQPGGDEPTDNSVHDCRFIKVGLDPGANGTVACTFNSARAAAYNNWFEECGFGAWNINISQGTDYGTVANPYPNGSDLTWSAMFFNNVVKNCATLGSQPAVNTLTHSSIPASMAPRTRVFCNTIYDHGAGGEIKLSNANPTGSSISNNLCPGGAITYGPVANDGTNVTSGTKNGAGTFVDETGTYLTGGYDLRPVAALPASGTIGVGLKPSAWASNVNIPSFDFNNTARTSPGADKGAIER